MSAERRTESRAVHPAHPDAPVRVMSWLADGRAVLTRAAVRVLESLTGEDDAYWADPIVEAFRADLYPVAGLIPVPDPPTHPIALGTPVVVTRDGVRQSWDATVIRHDRNGAYRLALSHPGIGDGRSYVSAYGSEFSERGDA